MCLYLELFVKKEFIQLLKSTKRFIKIDMGVNFMGFLSSKDRIKDAGILPLF